MISLLPSITKPSLAAARYFQSNWKEVKYYGKRKVVCASQRVFQLRSLPAENLLKQYAHSRSNCKNYRTLLFHAPRGQQFLLLKRLLLRYSHLFAHKPCPAKPGGTY